MINAGSLSLLTTVAITKFFLIEAMCIPLMAGLAILATADMARLCEYLSGRV